MRKNVHEAYKRAIGFRRRLEIGENTDEDEEDLSSAELFEEHDDGHTTDARRSSSNNVSDGVLDDDDDEDGVTSHSPYSRSPSHNNDVTDQLHMTKKNTTCPFIDSVAEKEEGAVCNGIEDEDDDDCGGTLNNHDGVFT